MRELSAYPLVFAVTKLCGGMLVKTAVTVKMYTKRLFCIYYSEEVSQFLFALNFT